MSKHNYSQYSNKNANNTNAQNRNKQHTKPVEKAPIIETEHKTVVTPEVKVVQETVETVTLPKIVKGIVAHCAKLNVRENAIVNSGIVCVLNAMSEVKIDVNKSTTNWFYVICANGAEGYCMREYIDAHV